jgi:hypothetical protein
MNRSDDLDVLLERGDAESIAAAYDLFWAHAVKGGNLPVRQDPADMPDVAIDWDALERLVLRPTPYEALEAFVVRLSASQRAGIVFGTGAVCTVLFSFCPAIVSAWQPTSLHGFVVAAAFVLTVTSLMVMSLSVAAGMLIPVDSPALRQRLAFAGAAFVVLIAVISTAGTISFMAWRRHEPIDDPSVFDRDAIAAAIGSSERLVVSGQRPQENYVGPETPSPRPREAISANRNAAEMRATRKNKQVIIDQASRTLERALASEPRLEVHTKEAVKEQLQHAARASDEITLKDSALVVQSKESGAWRLEVPVDDVAQTLVGIGHFKELKRNAADKESDTITQFAITGDTSTKR